MIEIRVPATSANLGPGFDCLGLALGLYNRFEIAESSTLQLDNVEPRFNNADNLFVQAFQKAGGENLHAVFHCDIPVSRGLGSSAAMITAGITAAYLLKDKPINAQAMFELASEMEGHPDNAAPCLFGGLTACMQKEDGSYIARPIAMHNDFRYTVLIPDFEVSTEEARAILPAAVSRKDASYTSAHAVLMCQALQTGDFFLLKEAGKDHFHEPYRKKLIHDFDKVKQLAEKDTGGLFLISGSGSTCLLISEKSLSKDALQQLPAGWKAMELSQAVHGAEIKRGNQWLPII